MLRNRSLCGAIAAVIVGLALTVGSIGASAGMVVNGSFEDNGGSLDGWVTGGTQLVPAFVPKVIVTNGVTGSASGEAIPVDNAMSNSPDPAGTHGVYFVDDLAQQFLRQTVFLAVGAYEIGFDAYAPFNGADNQNDATFSGMIAGVTLADFSVFAQTPAGVWRNFSGIANIVAPGNYDVLFEFQSFGVTGADVVIDRVFINATTAGGGTDIPPASVPEPATLVLFAVGLAGLGGMLRRRREETTTL